MNRSLRSAALVLGAAAAAGAFAFATPAAAHVEVSPATAAPGGSAEITLKLAEERPGAYTTKVELRAPESTPIAEIYALSIKGWAPLTSMRTLTKPAELIHGTTTTEVVAGITWMRAPSAGTARVPITLPVAMGPMPENADRVVFDVIQTYSDGTVVKWADPPKSGGSEPAHPAIVISLTGKPAPGGAHDGAHGGAAAPGAEEPALKPAASDQPSTGGSLGAGLLVGAALGLGGGAVAFVILRRRSGQRPDKPASDRTSRREQLAKVGSDS